MTLSRANVYRGDDDSESEDETNKELLEIINEGAKVDFSKEEEKKNFENAHAGEFDKRNNADRTILHCMTDFSIKAGSPRHDLLKWLIKQWPRLLTMEDNNKKTPIHCALQGQNKGQGQKKGQKKVKAVFVETALECAGEDILQDALSRCDEKNYNCLHLAIEAEFRSTELLISKSPTDVFKQQDLANGNTPLHLAMQLSVGDTKSQVEAFKEARQAEADSTLEKKKMGEKKREQEMQDWLTKEDVNRKTATSMQGRDGAIKSAEGSVSGDGGLIVPDVNRLQRRATGKLEALSPDVSEPPKQTAPLAAFYLPDIVEKLLLRCPDSLTVKNMARRTPYQERLNFVHKQSKSGSSESSDSGAIPTEPLVEKDIICQHLKHYCLREMDREQAIATLYESGKDRHIEFDLSGLPTASINETYLERLGKHLKFENCLQYVALPKLRVERNVRIASPRKKRWAEGPAKSKELDCVGLTDAEYIFAWLAEEKNVKKIIKIIVIDDGDVPHTEESIEKCLARFDIEIWDWRKFDISSETIYAAARDVRVVSLYSSGNNAVLREWSSENGLVRLKRLERVDLIIRKGLETTTRRKRNIKDFEQAFSSNWKKQYPQHPRPPEMKVVLDDQVKSIASGFQGGAAAHSKPIWLEYMDSFADYIAGITEETQEQIRVAVIDDGVDGFQEQIAENIIAGASFCRYSDGGDLMNAYYVPSGGHGTMMASLVCRVCPHAKLLIARLDEYKGQNNKRFITARSAAMAVNWAIEKRAHIISMSWTIESLPNELDTIEFKKAIEDANAKGIIMLCAFSDQGNVASTNCFPGAWQAPMIIGAATNYGSACTWVNKESVNFLFPGDQVIIDRIPKDNAKPESGSSMATGLAAGLAALLLYIAQLVDRRHFQELRQPDKMRAAFTGMCGDSKYVAVEKKFPHGVAEDDRWHWEGGDGRKELTKLVEVIVIGQYGTLGDDSPEDRDSWKGRTGRGREEDE